MQPSNFMYDCDDRFDFVVHGMKHLTDTPYANFKLIWNQQRPSIVAELSSHAMATQDAAVTSRPERLGPWKADVLGFVTPELAAARVEVQLRQKASTKLLAALHDAKNTTRVTAATLKIISPWASKCCEGVKPF